MPHPLVRRLEGLDPTLARWSPRAPAPEAKIAAVEAELGHPLPDDLRALLLRWGGGTLTRPGRPPLSVGPLADLLLTLEDPLYGEHLAGWVIIGGDGGGGLLVADPAGARGLGRWALFTARAGDLDAGALRPLAPGLSAAVDALLG
jgi:hypothetical protein